MMKYFRSWRNNISWVRFEKIRLSRITRKSEHIHNFAHSDYPVRNLANAVALNCLSFLHCDRGQVRVEAYPLG